MPKSWALGAALAVSMGWSAVACAQATIPDEYAKVIQQHSRIGMLDGAFFGDQVGLSTGSLAFVQTDVDLPGNNALPVRVGRRFEVGQWPAKGHFADWDLDIPHLHGVFGGPDQYSVAWLVDGEYLDHRCSEFNYPPEITAYLGGVFSPDEYWYGTFFYLPGSGDQELLWGGDVPATGGPYPATTREGAAARCTTSLAPTSQAGSSGEGFEVVTPDGTVYTFNQMVSRYVDDLHKTDPAPLLRTADRSPGKASFDRLPRGTQGEGGSGTCCNLPREEFFLYPTKVTDRFGNTVTYVWDSTNPWRLLHIIASDGRQLDLAYTTYYAHDFIASVSDPAHAHTWTYAYAGNIAQMNLTSVTQPDQRTWQFGLSDLYRSAKAHPIAGACDTLGFNNTSWDGSITAPSGATALYTVVPVMFGRSWAFRDCKLGTDQSNEYVTEPYLFVSVAITGKTITGPGLPANGLRWAYGYGAPNDCWNPSGAPTNDPDAVICTDSSPVSRTTTVTEPDGTVNHYTFGNQVVGRPNHPPNEGLLLSEDHGPAGGPALRTTTYAYGDGDAAPYNAHQGESLRRRGDWIITGQRRPQRSVTTSVQNGTFSWSVPTTCSGMPYCFDARARPTTVVRSGSGGTARTEATTYYDNEALWVLGQVAQVKCVAPTGSCGLSGTEMSATTYDAATALPLSTSAFDKLRNTFAYDTTSAVNTGQRGTLLTVADGNGNTTTYSNWKRGIPQSVHFPATAESPSGATRTAVVDDFGWIESGTDENGYATNYAYDAMGRITQVTYPTETSGGWNSTVSTFAPVTSAENGLALGHWKETVHTGNGYKVTLFDALWRPVLVHEYDSGTSGTDRYVATAYDNAGRVIDASYPLGASGSTLALDTTTDPAKATWQLGAGGARPSGVRTLYDGLGRPISVQQDSELGVLATTTEYLNGFQRRTTDARGNATTEYFMAWDSPNFDLPTRIDAPEHQRTLITRDIFGKPTAITRQEVSP